VATPTARTAKPDTPSHKHLAWLIESRAANQRSALLLHLLLEKHFEPIRRDTALTTRLQVLAAICFSLWRAAFLADKTGVREDALGDVRIFLGKMLTDNAITYPQDRSSREWTFNYYMSAAKNWLVELSARWPAVSDTMSAKGKAKRGSSKSVRRWDRHQAALTVAIEAFRAELEGSA
jgi:hypothetical protein